MSDIRYSLVLEASDAVPFGPLVSACFPHLEHVSSVTGGKLTSVSVCRRRNGDYQSTGESKLRDPGSSLGKENAAAAACAEPKSEDHLD